MLRAIFISFVLLTVLDLPFQFRDFDAQFDNFIWTRVKKSF